MNFSKAKNLIQIDFEKLNDANLQKYKVNIIDAWRYARGDYGFNNDFFVFVGEVNAFVPHDYWLLKNIEHIMNKLNI